MDFPAPRQPDPPWDLILKTAVHEIRTPLSSIRTTSEILRLTASRSGTPEKFSDMLDSQVDLIEQYLETLLNNPGKFSTTSNPQAPGI